MKIAIGNDHAACDMKNDLVKYLQEKGHTLTNVGTDTNDSCDYPDYAKKVADLVVSKEVDFGILVCGTGIGMSIAANKVSGIRAALCTDPLSAALTKQHNNANIITLGARITGPELAKAIVDSYIEADFEGGKHQRRVDKIMSMEG